MSKETELSDEQIDGCWDGLMPSGNGKSRYDIARAIIAADRAQRQGDAIDTLPERVEIQAGNVQMPQENVSRGFVTVRLIDAQAALTVKDAELEALTKQASAYKTLTESLEHRNATLQAGRAQWQEAVTTLASERQANALLTAEIATLTAERDVLKKDAERYRKDALRAATVAFGLVASSHPKELPDDSEELARWIEANAFHLIPDDMKPEDLFIKIIRAAIAKEVAK